MEFMDSQQHQNRRNKDDEKQYHEGKLKQGSKESQETKQLLQPTLPSPSSSPSHEFSFTISLQPSSASSRTTTTKSTANYTIPDKTKSSTTPSAALDLSPADEIFFHGHLLPLHLLSNLPVSPRSSTNSLDSFTLPIKELNDVESQKNTNNIVTNISKSEKSIDCRSSSNINHDNDTGGGGRVKSKSFSIFGLSSKWRKDNVDAREKVEDKERQKRKQKFDVSHVLKRYMRMVRPLLSFGGSRRSGNLEFHRQAYSYSGNLSLRRKPEFRGRRGEFSAPASMRTSPTNSGLLVAATGTLSTCSTSDSTMEELQAAIQAAIAHCKNSIAMEEKIKCHD